MNEEQVKDELIKFLNNLNESQTKANELLAVTPEMIKDLVRQDTYNFMNFYESIKDVISMDSLIYSLIFRGYWIAREQDKLSGVVKV